MIDLNKLTEMVKDKDVLKKLASEESKTALLKYVNEKVLPTAKDAGETYINKLQEQSKSESGWFMFRDAFFIPAVIRIGYYLFETATKIMLEKTEKITQ
jgi:hypothetical protein